MSATPTIADVQQVFRRRYQQLLDRTVVHTSLRWAGLIAGLSLYTLRVYLLQGWFIVTYGLGIYLLNLFIGFLSPQIDPDTDGPLLPVKTSEGEFRPFTRKVPEFQFWHKAAQALVVAFCMTFTNLFNIPVFWPILVFYFVSLFGLTMRKQIMHMIKHRYIPFDIGKKRWGLGGKKKDGSEKPSEPRFTGSNLR